MESGLSLQAFENSQNQLKPRCGWHNPYEADKGHMIDFKNKTVLVTGGTRGIGEAMVKEFASLGARVIATGAQKQPIEKLQAENKLPAVEYLHLDFCDQDCLQTALKHLDQVGRVDVLVNNAGVNKINPIWQIEEDDWDWIMQVNLNGLFQLTKKVSQLMKAQQWGRILNIASIFGVVSKEKRATYSTTKFGLIGFTKGIALDLAPHNVLVNALSPGFVETELTRSILSAEEREALAGNVPMGRFAQPEEIAKAALFLCSEQNTYMTGQNIVIDGGFVSG